jgi:hypothetical protein
MSKNQFLELREQEVANLYPATFTKKEAIKTGQNLAQNIIDGGNVSKHTALANLVRLNEVISNAIGVLKDAVKDIKANEMGIEFNPTNGRQMIQYSEDPIYAEIQKQLKDREELLKVALKTDSPFYDSEGIEVPKVSVKYASDSLNIKY